MGDCAEKKVTVDFADITYEVTVHRNGDWSHTVVKNGRGANPRPRGPYPVTAEYWNTKFIAAVNDALQKQYGSSCTSQRVEVNCVIPSCVGKSYVGDKCYWCGTQH
jgi:hypothetical protein